MSMKSIGEKIREIRKEKGFPQKQVADLLNVQRPNYSKIENDKQNLTPHQIKLLCEFFDLSADYLLDISVDNKKTISKYEQDYMLDYIEKLKATIK